MIVESSEHWLHLKNVRIPRRGEWKHQAENWCILLLKRGSGILQEGACSHGLRVGEIALLPAGTEGLVRAAPDSEALISCLLFAAKTLEGCLSLGGRLVFRHAANFSRGAKVVFGSSALSRRVKDLLQDAPPPRDSETHAETSHDLSAITQLLEELMEFLIKFRPSTGSTPGRLFEVLASIDESVLQGLSVDDLARRCGYSRRHLSRLVREHCDCSLASLRMELRLDKAAGLLRATNHKILDVAMDCGFNHQGSFTAKFRRRFGLTPREWRKAVADPASLNGPMTVSPRNRGGIIAVHAQSR